MASKLDQDPSFDFFEGDPTSTICVNLLANKHANKQTNGHENYTSLAEAIRHRNKYVDHLPTNLDVYFMEYLSLQKTWSLFSKDEVKFAFQSPFVAKDMKFLHSKHIHKFYFDI